MFWLWFFFFFFFDHRRYEALQKEDKNTVTQLFFTKCLIYSAVTKQAYRSKDPKIVFANDAKTCMGDKFIYLYDEYHSVNGCLFVFVVFSYLCYSHHIVGIANYCVITAVVLVLHYFLRLNRYPTLRNFFVNLLNVAPEVPNKDLLSHLELLMDTDGINTYTYSLTYTHSTHAHALSHHTL